MMARFKSPIELSDASDAVASRVANSMLVIAALAMGQAIQINNGVIHPAALGWLGLSIITLVIALRPPLARQFKLLARVPTDALLAGCIAIQLIELIYWDIHWSSISSITVAAFLVAGASGYFMLRHPADWKFSLALMLTAFVVAGVMTIRSMPNPIIDVFEFQQEASSALLHGHNPYGVQFRDLYGRDLGFYGPGVSVNGWLTYSFPYPPLTALLDLPGRALGDIRYSHLAALVIAATLLVLAMPSRRAVLAATMLLFTPRSMLVIKAAWTEPMVILTVAFVVFCARRLPTKLWLALGLMLAVKQYMVLALPIIPLLIKKENWPQRHRGNREKDKANCSVSFPVLSVPLRPTLLKAFCVAAAITLPFIAWNPIAFVRSVMLWQFRQPFRTDSLSYPAMISRTIGGQPGIWVSLLAAGAAILIARSQKTRGGFAFACTFAFVMLVFFAMSKQAFCNYYFLVIGLTCTAIAQSSDASNAGSARDMNQDEVDSVDLSRIAA